MSTFFHDYSFLLTTITADHYPMREAVHHCLAPMALNHVCSGTTLGKVPSEENTPTPLLLKTTLLVLGLSSSRTLADYHPA
jgi:hypothetical protein